MSSLLSKEEQKKRLAEKKDAQAREARLAREKEKREKKERQKEEQRKKSMSNDKTKKLTGIEAIRAAEREAEELAAAGGVVVIEESDNGARDARAAANGAGEAELFAKKMTKEEKKAAAAKKKAERSLKKKSSGKSSSSSKKSGSGGEGGEQEPDDWGVAGEEAPAEAAGGGGGGGKAAASRAPATLSKRATALERSNFHKRELEAELEAARVAAARERSRLGAYKGALEASAFTLANPGGGAPLLEDAACTLVRGRCYGLIGRNGKGKSTMLRALAARRVGDVPSNVTVHYVSQEVHVSEETEEMLPGQCVVAADVERRLLLEESADLEARADRDELDAEGAGRLGEVLERLDMIGSDTAERRADELLANLGFSEELRGRPLRALSGGWRVRTMLAAAIFARPDLLLLDEPTNHLSITAVLWLARELSTSEVWKERTIVVVSHDRAFIDEVCSDVLHISGAARRLTQSHGNYSTWAARRAEQKLAYDREVSVRAAKIGSLKEYAGHGFRYGGSGSQINKMKMKEKQAGKLEEEAAEQAADLAALREDMELPLQLKSGGELPGFIVQMRGVAFGYPGTGTTLFSGADFSVTSQSRVVLLGENGNGKTTLVKIMLGELVPTEGEVLIKSSARVALVNQHHADQIDLELTPLEFMAKTFPAPEGVTAFEHLQRLRGHLAGCGVTGGSSKPSAGTSTGSGGGAAAAMSGKDGGGGGGGDGVMDLQNVPAAALSGGQRSRVALAAVSYREPHVLVLDEPTNNLDLESVAALAESVKAFKGAVVCVSHDQYFVNAIANEAWVVANGAVKRVESFEAYRQKQLKKLNKQSPPITATGRQ